MDSKHRAGLIGGDGIIRGYALVAKDDQAQRDAGCSTGAKKSEGRRNALGILSVATVKDWCEERQRIIGSDSSCHIPNGFSYANLYLLSYGAVQLVVRTISLRVGRCGRTPHGGHAAVIGGTAWPFGLGSCGQRHTALCTATAAILWWWLGTPEAYRADTPIFPAKNDGCERTEAEATRRCQMVHQ